MSSVIKKIKTTKAVVLPLALAVPTLLSAAVHAATPDSTNGFHSMNTFEVVGVVNDNEDFGMNDADGQQYFTQVLDSRGGYTFKDKYSVNYWVKIGEMVWGVDDGQNTPNAVNEVYEMTINTLYGGYRGEKFNLAVGMLPVTLGNGYNVQLDGLTGSSVEWNVSDKLSVLAFAGLVDENDATEDVGYEWSDSRDSVDGDSDYGDEYMLGVQVGTKFDGGDASFYYAADFSDESYEYSAITEDDAEGEDWNLQTVGVSGHYTAGKISYEGEAMTFFGDASDGTDYTGLQVQLGATYKLEKGSVQANLYYAKGADEDETQATSIKKLGMVQPMQQGLGKSFDHSDNDLKIIAAPVSMFMLSQNSGVIGAAVNGSYSVSQPVELTAGLIFLVPENDSTDTDLIFGSYSEWESLTVVNAAVHYSVNENVSLGAGASYKSFTADSGSDLGDSYAAAVRVGYSF